MSTKPNVGKAEAEPVQILPDLPFDLLEGKPRPANLGKTDVPVIMLPNEAFDLATEAESTPVETP